MSTPDPLVALWCAENLGSPAVEQFLGLERISAVHGVLLADGREVVVKVRDGQPRLQACAQVHRALWGAGIPCPGLLAGPLPLAEGPVPVPLSPDGVDARALAVTAESWEGEGFAALGHLGAGGYAALLARMVAAAPPVAELPTLQPPVPWLWWDHAVAGRTWPPTPYPRWDPHRIDDRIPPVVHDTARRARARLLRPDVASLPLVAGHGDFSAQNCRWVDQADGSRRLVIHDWDSIVAMPEAVLAGNSALTFIELDEGDISSIAENDEFLAAYAHARGRPWSELEWQVAHATTAWVAAYNSAFEHLKDGPARVTAGLVEQAAERLRRADA